jgi:hypothetical protein
MGLQAVAVLILYFFPQIVTALPNLWYR